MANGFKPCSDSLRRQQGQILRKPFCIKPADQHLHACQRQSKRARIGPLARSKGRQPFRTAAQLKQKEGNGEMQFQPDSGAAAWSGDYSEGQVLGEKYTVQSVIGRGSNGVTYKAKTKDGKEVAVKALSLRRMTGWKQLELFEREAKILEALSHPGIPQYIDYFEEDSQQDRGFFLVQELAQGKSLLDLVKGGWRADESEAKRIAAEILKILDYLKSRAPPVVHRDVKPDNIVLEGGKAGGRVFLVDFGGVQAAATTEAFGMGSTVIGSYGYMAPEQFRGAAQPESDLYGLGGTLLYLLSGQPPNAFPQDRMQVKFRDVLNLKPATAALLEGLLEPVIEDRISAADALALLMGDITALPSRIEDQPPGAVSKVEEKRGTLNINIPPGGLSTDKMGLAGFALTWNVGIGAWTVSAIAAGSVVAAAFSLPFWAAGTKRRTIEGRTKDLKGAQVVTSGYINGVPSTEIKLVEGFSEHRFGSGLSLMEQQWVATKIMSFLEKMPGQPKPSIPLRQKALGEELREQAQRKVQENLQRSGIIWPGDHLNDGWIGDRYVPSWERQGPQKKPSEYDAEITWIEDQAKPTTSQKDPPSGRPAKDQGSKKDNASFGNIGTDDDAASITSDDLGLVSAPDDSIATGGSDSDERHRRR